MIHYGETLYTPELKRWGQKYLAALPPEINTILSTGSSGCALASAMLCISRRKLKYIYLPKEGEQTHRARHGCRPPLSTPVAIVNDFIVTGVTVRRCIHYAETQGLIPVIIITNTTGSPEDFKDKLGDTIPVKGVV